MRVLLVSHRFLRHSTGGTEVLTDDIARWLARRRHSVVWLAVGREGACDIARRVREDGVEEWEIPPGFPSGYPVGWMRAEEMQATQVARCLSAFASSGRVDAVHVFHFARIGLSFLDLEALRGAARVATLTDYTAICLDYQLRKRRAGVNCGGDVGAATCLECVGAGPGGRDAVEDVASWRARNVALLSKWTQRIYVQTPYQRRVLERAGMSTTSFRRDRAAYDVPVGWRRLAQQERTSYTFAYIGRWSEEKGADVAVRAFRLVREMSPDVRCRLRMVSPTPASERVGASGDLEWLGSAPHAELGRILEGVDCLLVPSLWLENHPMVLTYALEAGASALCSDLPSLQHLRGTRKLRFAAPGDIGDWRDQMIALATASEIEDGGPTGLPPFEELAADIETRYRSAGRAESASRRLSS